MTAGLRERNRERTRTAIQAAALRLIAAQGYDATSCDQIAAGAGVSPATLFRYFPTKEDIVLDDVYDPMIARLVAGRPAGEGPVTATRHALATALGSMDPAELEVARQRTGLILSVRALRARTHEQRSSLADHLAAAFAERDRTLAPLAARVAAEAVAAAVAVAVEEWAADESPLAGHVDRSLGALAALVDPTGAASR